MWLFWCSDRRKAGICALLPDSQSRLVPVSGRSAHGPEGVGRGHGQPRGNDWSGAVYILLCVEAPRQVGGASGRPGHCSSRWAVFRAHGQFYQRRTVWARCPARLFPGNDFPAELSQDPDLFVRVASRIYETPGLLDKLSLSGVAVPERMTAAWVTDRVRDTPAIREIVGQMMQDHARYPSQLYEAFAEGVFLLPCCGLYG